MSQKQPLKAGSQDSNFVRGIPLFAGLPEAEKDSLMLGGRVCTFQRRQAIFRQGDALDNFYIVCKGNVQLYRTTPGGREITLDILVPGDMSCTREIFELSAVHMVNASAVSTVVVVAFPRMWLLETAQRNSVFALNLLSTLSRRSRMMEVDAEHQATMSAPQLIACYLMHLADRYNFDPHGFELPLSKSLIASRLGMELETFSRALPTLNKYGISVTGKNVSLHDFAAAEESVCGHCSVRETCHARQSIVQKKDDKAAKASVRSI